MIREDGRRPDDLRQVRMTPGYTRWAEGSVLIEMGETRVLCTATLEDKVPHFLKGLGQGWVTAEYAMLPRATHSRTPREVNKGKPSGRTQEIQRLIGRALRSVVDLKKMGEKTLLLDCDVIQADGGTRTAAITGAYAAMMLAFEQSMRLGQMTVNPVTDWLAAVSVGKLQQGLCLDLNYSEDSRALVDMNLVMTGRGGLVEIQGTAEAEPFTRQELEQFLDLGQKGIDELIKEQKKILGREEA